MSRVGYFAKFVKLIVLIDQSIYLMTMSIASNQLDAFMAVAELLNFTKAAAKLHITQSALSQRIMNLEEELKITLFIRDRAGLKLTDHAYALVRYCQTKNSLEAEFLEGLTSQNAQELAGVLRIGGFSSVMRSVIQPSLSSMIQENQKLRLLLMTKEMYELPDLLKRGEIDYMILDNRLDREELERVSLGYEHNVLVQKRKYKGPEIYLDHDSNDSTTEDYFKVAERKNKKLQRQFLGDVYGLLDGVHDSLGLAVLPKHLITTHRDLEILNPEIVLKVPISIYFYQRPFYSKLHEAFLAQLLKVSHQILPQS